jgi:hypothetical protein
VVLVGLLGGARAPRVDDHDLAAARPDRPQAAAHVGRREQAAVGVQRVRAEDQQVVGAIEVGHRDRQLVAEQQRRRDLLGALVDRAGRVHVPRPERLGQHPHVEQRREVVRTRIADVQRRRVAAAGLEDRPQPLGDDRIGLVPARRHELAVAAHERPAHAVGILVQVLERDSLRAQEAVAEDVVAVAADRGHRVAVEPDLQAAGRLAQRAGAVRGA